MLAALVFAATPAFPQMSETLVSNTDKIRSSGSNLFFAQDFTTGSQGATLSDIQIRLGVGGTSISVKLRKDNGSGRPNMGPSGLVATLTNPNSLENNKLNKFTVPTGNTVTLAANTTYWISVHEGTTNAKILIQNNSDDETTAKPGWSIGNNGLYRAKESDTWSTTQNGLVIAVRGTLDADTTAPTLSSAAVNGTALTLTYSEDLDTSSTPAATAFAVTVDSGTAASPSSVAIAGKVVTLTLGSAVTSGQTVTVSYTVPTGNNSKPIRDKAATPNNAAALTNEAVANNTAPKLSGAAVDGDSLTLTYDGNLKTTPLPAASAFSVTVDSGTAANLLLLP